MEPAYTYFDGTGFGHPWELLLLSNYTLRTKSGQINGYASQFQMAVSYNVAIQVIIMLGVNNTFVSLIPINSMK